MQPKTAPTPAYYKPTIPSQKRRAPWHNYYGKSAYMVTFNKRQGCPALSTLEYTQPETAFTNLTPTGQILQGQIEATPGLRPEVKIHDYVIMPDHVHILLEVLQPMQSHLGDVVQAIKATTTSRIRKLVGDPDLDAFEEGFHDRVIIDDQQFERVRSYILDNPRRLAVRRANPDFFRLVSSLTIGGHECRAYGNLQLLENPFKEQVVVHRADSPDQRARNRARLLYTAANGGVLVSPFISPAEKAIRDEAEEAGSRFILITNDTIADRYKPAGHDFDLCNEGRLLIISPGIDTGFPASHPITRTTCLALNALAATLAAGR